MKKTQDCWRHKCFREGHETAGFFYTTTQLHIRRWWPKSTFPSTTLRLRGTRHIPSDLFLFLRLKIVLKGQRLASSEEVTAKATRALEDVSKNGFQSASRNLTNASKSVSLS
jgi:hypothetical protein